jgi:flagellar protein FlbD
MINLTRLNGQAFVLNCDLIERVDATPDTVLTLVDGTKYVVTENLDEVVNRVRAFRSSVIAAADVFTNGTAVAPVLHVVPDSEER